MFIFFFYIRQIITHKKKTSCVIALRQLQVAGRKTEIFTREVVIENNLKKLRENEIWFVYTQLIITNGFATCSQITWEITHSCLKQNNTNGP